MAYCPIISYQCTEGPYAKRTCMGKDCAFWNGAVENCLIRAYLISQIEKSNIVIKPVSSPSVTELTPLDTYFGGGTK